MAEDKTFSQMKQEFTEFYHNEIKKRLPAYIKMRREEGPMQLAFWFTVSSFLLVFAFIMWFQFVSPTVFKFFPNLEWTNTIVKILFGIDIAVCVASFVIMIIIDRFTANKSNTSGGTRYIKSDLEMELKRYLMPRFVRIFFADGFWIKNSTYEANSVNSSKNTQDMQTYLDSYNRNKNNMDNNSIKNVRDLKILNPYLWLRRDDLITGSYKNVHIKINEVNTKILLFPELFVILFLFIWLTGFTGGVFLVLFLVLFLPWVLIICLIFSFKIIQYSLFRGVIVEFDMNKNFKGHTIFHENSSIAKKIPLEKKYYKKVNLESVTFENKYNVYSNDQIEARYILTPSLIERIENLKFAFKAKYVRGSFKNNKLTLAIHTGKDMFAMGSDFKDSDIHTFEELYDEIISVLQIVDELKLNENTGL